VQQMMTSLTAAFDESRPSDLRRYSF